MKPDERDLQVLLHIAYHCCVIEETIRQFGKDKERFDNSIIYRNAVSMPLMQIGELVKHLSARFKETHPEIPWKKISGMRDYFAHDYFGRLFRDEYRTNLEHSVGICTRIEFAMPVNSTGKRHSDSGKNQIMKMFHT